MYYMHCEHLSFHIQLLRAELGSRAYVGTLARDSSNVVDLVETLYRVSLLASNK